MGLYTYDYFCGANCSVYIGDTWVDDLVYLSYEANSSKIPVYGYASTHWDAMLPGRVLIQGTFGIAFKETILIPAIIRSFRYDQLPQEDFDVRTPLTDGQKIKDLEAENIRSGKYRTSLYNYLNSLSVKDFKSETKNLEQKLFGSAYNLDAISELESLEYYKDGFNIFTIYPH